MENCVRNEIELSGDAAKLVRLIILLTATAMAFAAESGAPEAKKVDLPYVTIDHPQFSIKERKVPKRAALERASLIGANPVSLALHAACLA